MLLRWIPPFHAIIAVFEVGIILIARLHLRGRRQGQGVIEVDAHRLPMLRLIGSVTLLALSVERHQVVEEILQRMAAIFVIGASRKRVPLVVKTMPHGKATQADVLVVVIIVYAAILAHDRRCVARLTAFLIAHLSLALITSVAALQVERKAGAGQL